MPRFSSMKYAPAETRRILRDRFARYLPVLYTGPSRPNTGNLVRDEQLLNLLLNLDLVFESEIDRARATYEATLPPNSGEPSFDEVIEAGWLRVVWGRLATTFEVDQRARAVPPGTMTALVSLLTKRFKESHSLREAARGGADLAAIVTAIERGELSPRALRSQDPQWVAARLWDRIVTDSGLHRAELRVWVDRWRLLGSPTLVPHEAWSETAVNAFRETAIGVLESEQGLVGWEETRTGFVREMALRSGQPSASAERYVAPVPGTVVDRAEWLGEIRLEGLIAGAMSANGDLAALVGLILSDVESEEFSPGPHGLASRLIELALQRPEIFVVLLFRLRWRPVLLADLLLYPATSALACSLIAQWLGPSGAWDRELRARDDLATKAMAFTDAVSVLGEFLELGSIDAGEVASLLTFLHKTAEPIFRQVAERNRSMLAILQGELARQSAETNRQMFAALSSRMPEGGLGTSVFAAALDIVDAGVLAGSIDAAPLLSAYIDSTAAGAYSLSAGRTSGSAAASLVMLAMSAPPALREKFLYPIDIRARMAAASEPGVNLLEIEDSTARSIRAHVRVLCRAVSGLQESSPDDVVAALTKAVRAGALKHDEKGRVASFGARYETELFRGFPDRPIAADLAAALAVLRGEQREKFLLAILEIDEPAVLAQLIGLAPHAAREWIERRIDALTPSDAGEIRSLPEALVRIEELLSAGRADAAGKFIEAERGLRTWGLVSGRELTRLRIGLRLKLLRKDWRGIASTEPPPELSAQARDEALEVIRFFNGLAALGDPHGDREGAERFFTSLQHRHPEVAAYAVNLLAARITLLLGAGHFAELQGTAIVRGRHVLTEAEESMLHLRDVSAADLEVFNTNKALLLLALGQPDQAYEVLASTRSVRLRDSAAAFSAISLTRMGRVAEGLLALDQAEKAVGKTDILKAAREHIQNGKHFAAAVSITFDDNPIPRIKAALFDLSQMDHHRQAEILVEAPQPFESLVIDHMRRAAESVTSLVPMMKNIKIDSREDHLTALLRVLLVASIRFLGWTVPDQSLGGYSAKGNPGERDLVIQKNGTTLAVVEAIVCRNPTTHKSTRDDLTSHFQKLFGYSTCTLFFHLTYAYIESPASILDFLKQMAERDAPRPFALQTREDIVHTDSRPIGFIAGYQGAFGPVKVVFLLLDMIQHVQKEAAKTAGETNPH
jgi:hypothetical protein